MSKILIITIFDLMALCVIVAAAVHFLGYTATVQTVTGVLDIFAPLGKAPIYFEIGLIVVIPIVRVLRGGIYDR